MAEIRRRKGLHMTSADFDFIGTCVWLNYNGQALRITKTKEGGMRVCTFVKGKGYGAEMILNPNKES